jgi:hypothetical protein
MVERRKKYAQLGESPQEGQSKKSWIVPIDEYHEIVFRSYFITTGEATTKIDVLIEDLNEALKEAKKLKKELIKTKGECDYLETCWEDGDLIVKQKIKRGKN